MLVDIVLALGPSVLDAIGTSFMACKEKQKLKRELNEILKKQFAAFADTSLDCSGFYKLIGSSKFIEIIRGYFILINDRLSVEEYRSNIEDLICEECENVNRIDVRRFIKKLEVLYIDFLHNIITGYPEIYACFQLLSFSHREILSKILDSTNELKRYLTALVNRNIYIDDEKIKKYHFVTQKEFSEIRFTGIAGAERRKIQNINEFYVENTFSYLGKDIDKLYDYNISDKIPNIKLENFFDLGNKLILIGGAGFGKTTTLNYLFCNYEKLFDASAIKFKIDLKEYAKEIGEKKRSILWCISNEFIKRTIYEGKTIDEIQMFISSKLSEGKCLVILDALDEIPTQSLRNSVRNEIESFASIYYLNRFIISTREVGYLRNRFDDTFLHIRINTFDIEQIKQYSWNWYFSYYDKEKNDQVFEEFWNKFDEEVTRAKCENLIKNPIILILALVIFDIGKNLPTRRVEFYEKCIDTFLTERELGKGTVSLTEKAKSILAMNLTIPQIASYKHDKIIENAGYKFRRSELEKSILEAIDVEDVVNWAAAVKEYSDYLIERTELIKEIDEDVYDFAHKTFFEYFLAFYFAKMYENSKIKTLLYKWIGDPNYDELSRLIIEVIIKNNNPKQYDFIIDRLFEILLNNKYENKQRVPNKRDVFSVIADLYSHNLLQPKYQSKYNQFILYNSHYVDYLYRDSRLRERKNDLLLYDSQEIANMFIQNYENNLDKVVDAIRYLNNDFRKNIIQHDKSGLLYQINKLFNSRFVRKKDVVEDDLNYFIDFGLEYTLLYPQIYLSVVSILLELESEETFERLLNYKFSPSSVFYRYTNPSVLIELMRRAMNSKTYFAILLICIVECGYKSTNSILHYLLNNYGRSVENENIKKFAEKVFFVLYNSKSFNEFRDALLDLDLYNEKYDKIYNNIIQDYNKNEKDLSIELLRKCININ